jgi:UDP-2,4-diacetamido-2,4,6-trideoxy-beta-L-altropyranose hydrolase
MVLTEKPLLIRADANARMGIGHLMRCLALAQGWRSQGGQVTFVTACESDSLRQRLSEEGFRTVTLRHCHPHPSDWDTTSEVLADHPGAWVVLDGYHFDPAYQSRIKTADHRLLVIDDMAHLDHYYADVVLNQNIHAETLDYVCEPFTCLLLGTRYVLLRREFWPWREWEREIPEVARKVLITLGGGDPDNQTLKVIRALQRVDVDGLEATVVVGASNPHFREVESAASGWRGIRLVRNVSNIPELMSWADMAVTAGGSTCWEIAYFGLPSVLLVLAENQREIAEGLHRADVSLNLGWYEEVTRERVAEALSNLISDRRRRQQMSHNGNNLVDGKGAERVVLTVIGRELGA